MKLSEIQKYTQSLPQAGTAVTPAQIQDFLHSIGIDPGGFYQELEMDNEYVDAHQDISYENGGIQFHSHAFYELLCCRSSCGAEYLVGTERYKLQKGDIVFVPPGLIHRPLLPEHMDKPYIRDVIWVSPSFMQSVSALYPNVVPTENHTPLIFRTTGTRWGFLCDLFRDAVLEAERKEFGWESILIAKVITLIVQMQRTLADRHSHPLKAEKPDLVDQVLSYVELHLSEKITLADIAHHFFISESTITQSFRKEIGISFYRCVTQRRLIAAKRLIEEGYSMEAVAETVGFSDYSSFFRAFKQEYGISPRQYRKLHNNG